MTMTLADMHRSLPDLIRRAFAAWFKTGSGYPLHEQPDASMSSVDEIDGHTFVVLRNKNGVSAVYRVKNNGILRRMRRPPKELLWIDPNLASSTAQAHQ